MHGVDISVITRYVFVFYGLIGHIPIFAKIHL